jgi:hypothetical protein
METDKKIFHILLYIFMITLFCSCSGGITNVKYTPTGSNFPPYTGEIKVFWKEHGVPKDPNSYVFVGRVSGQSLWCGVTLAQSNTELHQHLIDQAGKHGGNGIILMCGEVGSVGQCFCYGDIIRFK